MWSQSAGSGLACMSCVTGTNVPDCAATRTTGPADTTAQTKNATTRYALFIDLPPLVDGYELLDRALKLETSPLEKNTLLHSPGQTTSARAGHRRRYNCADSRVGRQSIVSSRRAFLKIASLATAYAATRGTALAAADGPALGLIFPPLYYPIPPDAKRLYPAGVRFLGDGVGLSGGMTIDGYEEAIPRLIPAAERLAKQGAQVISFLDLRSPFIRARNSTRN